MNNQICIMTLCAFVLLLLGCAEDNSTVDLNEDPLVEAAVSGNVEYLNAIIDIGGFDQGSVEAQEALHVALGLFHNEFAVRLIDSGVDPVKIHSVTGANALHTTVASKNNELIKVIMDKGVSPCAVNLLGMTALHWAARNNDVEALLVLLEGNGKDCVNQQAAEIEGRTPLHLAVGMENFEAVKVLIQNGADPYIQDDNRLNSLQLAEQRGFQDLVDMMLSGLN